ncbi:hypothetical protein NDU88_004092 [Pleurodeles waltl]|uniref:Uncharacterized protein n=1 Tax=Pleurodeles waltl TaxID=8319 RepID=A0AAV7TQW8_PLEWA|nr:hypothetical protein NDU88_004092 [Pleurodeles waltl]
MYSWYCVSYCTRPPASVDGFLQRECGDADSLRIHSIMRKSGTNELIPETGIHAGCRQRSHFEADVTDHSDRPVPLQK